jgi:hypothetical protein
VGIQVNAMSNDDLLEILRDAVMAVAGKPEPYEGITGAEARLWVARRKVVEALIRLCASEVKP